MQLADEALIFDMLDEELLRSHINSVDPDLIVPEIEAINTQVLLDIEADRIVPSGRAVDLPRTAIVFVIAPRNRSKYCEVRLCR